MADPLQSWIQQAEGIPGVLACGLRTGQTLIAKSCHKNYAQPQIEKFVREVAESVRQVQTNRISAHRIRWTFEHAWVYSSVRRDGAIAVLIVDNQSETSPEIDRLLAEFRLPPAEPPADPAAPL